MPKRTSRGRRRTLTALRAPASQPLVRLLDAPHLSRVVPHLAPETLHQLIRHHGLDACGELVAAATPQQLASVFDLDLWRNARPGLDEQFDASRFREWLEALVDSDSAVAARIVAAMDGNLVIAGLSRLVRVFDPATIVPAAFTDDDPGGLEAARRGGETECEVGGYLVRASSTEAWDAIVALLVALDADHHDCFHAVMRGCRRLSNSAPEVDGLDDLLMEPEQLIHDVALEREQRRSQQGYSTPADARAFLQMARQRRHPADRASARQPSTALLGGPRPRQSRLTHIRTLMEHVRDNDGACVARSGELAFLANTLVAGCSIQSRPFTPQEASDAAVAVCNLGLEHRPEDWLETDLVTAFEVGWAMLHEDVSMFVAAQLVDVLTGLRCADHQIQAGLNALRLEVRRQREAGTPWHACGALDVIAILDTPAWAVLNGLMNECPVIPEMLTATLDGRTGAVSATAFEFISTTSQISQVRAFVARLPDALRR